MKLLFVLFGVLLLTTFAFAQDAASDAEYPVDSPPESYGSDDSNGSDGSGIFEGTQPDFNEPGETDTSTGDASDAAANETGTVEPSSGDVADPSGETGSQTKPYSPNKGHCGSRRGGRRWGRRGDRRWGRRGGHGRRGSRDGRGGRRWGRPWERRGPRKSYDRRPSIRNRLGRRH